jgi:hypothetical protein
MATPTFQPSAKNRRLACHETKERAARASTAAAPGSRQTLAGQSAPPKYA